MKTAAAFLRQKFGTGWSRKALYLPIPDLLDIINEYVDFRERCIDTSPIDYVLTDELALAIRLCEKQVDYETVDKIIDLVELIVHNKGKVTLKDLVLLQEEWKK